MENKPICPASVFVDIKDKEFLVISKCACSTIKGMSLGKDKLREIHADNVGIPYNEGIKCCKRKVVIWRDPVERFISLYNNRLYWNKERVWASIDNFECFLNIAKNYIIKFLEGVDYKLMDIFYDEHFIPQFFWYNLSDIDTVVDIKDLDSYFAEECDIITIPHYNKSPITSKTLKKEDLSNELLDRIKELYDIDYKLYKDINESGKLWKPLKKSC